MTGIWLDALQWPAMAVTLVAAWLIASTKNETWVLPALTIEFGRRGECNVLPPFVPLGFSGKLSDQLHG